MIRTALGIVGAVVCALAIWESARIGYARTYALQSLKTNDLSKAEKSIQLLPSDAEVHAARGVILQRTANYDEAGRELERAAQLRPRDYYLWMMLGVTRDLNDDPAGGLTALRQAATLAPGYARPHWLLGNLLLRQGDIDSAFQELRTADERQPTLLPAVIDLAWGISKGDPGRTIAFINPTNDRARLALASFLASHNQPEYAIQQFRSIGTVSVTEADQLVGRLIDGRYFPEAYEIWSKSHCPTCRPASFINGSFEDEIDLSARGFGWQIPNEASGLTVSIDSGEHSTGARSLRIDFHGSNAAQATLASQVLLTEPGKPYRVSFAALAKSFVSTAAPVLKVIDASDENQPTVGQLSIKTETSTWQPYAIQFVSGVRTRGVRIVISRDKCAMDPCAAFGTLWLDSFVLAQE